MAYATSYRNRSYSRARGGFLSGLVRGIGRVASFIPGPIGTIAGQVTQALTRPTAAQAQLPTVMPGGVPLTRQQPSSKQLQRGVVATGVSPLGTVGVRFAGSRRMNVGNAKAARRAIRRIKGVRKMLQSIESQLPKRKCTHGGSRGVITRGEAARALRA